MFKIVHITHQFIEIPVTEPTSSCHMLLLSLHCPQGTQEGKKITLVSQQDTIKMQELKNNGKRNKEHVK